MKQLNKTFSSKKLLNTFGEKVLIAGTQSEMDSLIEKGVPEPIWWSWEVLLLKGKDEKMIRIINETKKVFPGATIYV